MNLATITILTEAKVVVLKVPKIFMQTFLVADFISPGANYTELEFVLYISVR